MHVIILLFFSRKQCDPSIVTIRDILTPLVNFCDCSEATIIEKKKKIEKERSRTLSHDPFD